MPTSQIAKPGQVMVWTLVAVVAGTALPSAGQAQRRQAEPFREFLGSWSGTGTISLANGSSERIRCQAVYESGADANTLRSTVRCASDSYKFELTSDVREQAGTLSGAWREVSRNVSGAFTGNVSPGQISAQINAPGFAASLALAARGRQQSVTITSQGTDLTGLRISLTRR